MNENIRLPKIAIPQRYEINLDINLEEFSYTGKEVVFLEIVDETKELQLHSLGIDIENAFIENDSGEHIEASINYLPEEERVSLIFEDKVTQGDWQLYLDFKATIVDELRGFYRSSFKDSENGTQEKANPITSNTTTIIFKKLTLFITNTLKITVFKAI